MIHSKSHRHYAMRCFELELEQSANLVMYVVYSSDPTPKGHGLTSNCNNTLRLIFEEPRCLSWRIRSRIVIVVGDIEIPILALFSVVLEVSDGREPRYLQILASEPRWVEVSSENCDSRFPMI